MIHSFCESLVVLRTIYLIGNQLYCKTCQAKGKGHKWICFQPEVRQGSILNTMRRKTILSCTTIEFSTDYIPFIPIYQDTSVATDDIKHFNNLFWGIFNLIPKRRILIL